MTITTGILNEKTYDNRTAFADELSKLARVDDRIVAVCNDSVGSSNLVAFRDEFPDRLINVGIAEQDLVGVGAGLANAGMIPFVCGAAPFLTGRSLEQIKADVAYSNQSVILCGMSPGMAYGELGPTHHSVEDFSWVRAIANLDVLAPADMQQTRQAINWAAYANRPVYMRIGRHKVPAVVPEDASFEYGRFLTLREGTDVTLIAVGTLVSRALAAADVLEADGISTRVINATFLSPLDEDAIVEAARLTRGIVTAEEANVAGGLGAAVASVLAEQPQSERVPMRIHGLKNEFAPTGSNDFLLEYFNLDVPSLVASAREVVSRA